MPAIFLATDVDPFLAEPFAQAALVALYHELMGTHDQPPAAAMAAPLSKLTLRL